MKKQKYYIIISILIVFVCLVTYSGINIYNYYSDYENKSYQISEGDAEKEQSNKTEFNETETKVVDAIYNKLNIYDYFDQNSLESIEITKIISMGYYESEPNIRYIQVEYTAKCKDGTYSCDHLSTNLQYNYNTEGSFFFYIKVDIKNYDYIERIDTIAADINSDWKSTDGKIQ